MNTNNTTPTNNPATDNNNDANATFYGKDAVVGNEGDANKADDIQITNNVGQTIQLNTDGGNSSLDNEPKEDNNGDNKGEGDNQQQNKEGDEGNTQEPPTDNTNKPVVDKSLADQMTANNDAMIALGKDLIAKGVDFVQAINEYQENGDVSHETYEALKKAGYPKEVIQGFIESRRAIDDAYTKSVYEYVGGEKEYRSLASWMSSNLSKDEIQAFNKVIDDGDTGMVKLMLDGIQAKRVAKQGTRKPTILGGATKPSGSTLGFANKTEMINAMSDKRYGVDREYTLGVERKMMYTDF